MATIWTDIDLLASYAAKVKGHFRLVCTSGGFDPVHVGHLRCLQAAAKLGDELIVIVNGDDFLRRKKGYWFMPLLERLEIIAGLECVDHVVAWDDGTQFVHGAISLLKPHIFAKGGDRSCRECIAEEELAICQTIGCELVYGVGGNDKIQSSSDLVANVRHGW